MYEASFITYHGFKMRVLFLQRYELFIAALVNVPLIMT